MSTFACKRTVGLAACAVMAVSLGILCRATSVRAADPVIEYRDGTLLDVVRQVAPRQR